MKRAILYGLFLWSALLLAAPDFPALSGRVVDQANFISSTDEASLTQKLKQLETDTSAQLVVVTVNSLQGYDIADYALQLGRHWEIGQKEKNNGVILLVSKADKKMRIEVGYGLEGTIPDAYASYVINSLLRPAFRQGEFSVGIVLATNKLIAKIKQDPSAEMPEAYTSDNSVFMFMLIPLFIFINGLVGQKFGEDARLIGTSVSAVLAWAITQDIVLALVVGVFVFFAAYNPVTQDRAAGANRIDGRGYRGGFGGGGFGGGGFGGGGGGFGGGGASGGW